jgi:DNA mismatch repair protein MutS2
VPQLGQTAEVLTAPDSHGELTVRFGLMKMTVSLKDIESLTGEKVAGSQDAGTAQSSKLKPQSSKPADTHPPEPKLPTIRCDRNTVDIRGSRVADAEPVLEKAIASAQTGALWIIHGHGTGKLRQGIHAFLQHHPQVERLELAAAEDGGAGVTIAYLR